MIIGFDADDTLWENEINYFEAEHKVAEIVSSWYRGDNFEDEIFKTEMSNLALFGYGAKGFTLSLVETALRVSKNEISGDKIEEIINIGKNLINKPVEIREGVEETLELLKNEGHTLLLITKGDLLDQKRKLEKSGLTEYFTGVEVMVGKSELHYADLLTRLSIDLSEFLMVGDSLRSDVLPVLAIGGWALYVPGNSRWKHERVEEEIHNERFITVEKINEVGSVVKKIASDKEDFENQVIEIYSDGGCLGNPGPGGWAFVLSAGTLENRFSGGDKDTTNNRMELTAVIKALEEVKRITKGKGAGVEIHTDSKYVKNGITSWIHNWKKNGWLTSAKKPVKNKDLWMRLDKLSKPLDISWQWVKGHSGNTLNEVCDSMVRQEMEKIKNK